MGLYHAIGYHIIFLMRNFFSYFALYKRGNIRSQYLFEECNIPKWQWSRMGYSSRRFELEDFKFGFIGGLLNRLTFRVRSGSGISWIALDFFCTEKCTRKNPPFQACSEIVLEFRILTINRLHQVAPSLDLQEIISILPKATFNRSSHQVTACPNWSWMSFSKLPYLLHALCHICWMPLLITFLYSGPEKTLK